MNCAVHTDTTATAYCRTCGKAMCPACAHNVRGVIYCEDCLAHRIGASAPAGAPPGTADPFAVHAVRTPTGEVVVTSGPSPGLAGVLAGFFPFGVGQVYTGQYAKGLAHLLIFAGLIFGLSSGVSDSAHAFLGIALSFFYVYQIIDAVRSAHAIRLGAPPPDPFGLGKTFTTGERVDVNKVPMGAVILIAIGVLFLFDTLGLFPMHWIGRLWPVILIVIGVWMFMKRCNPPVPRDGDIHGGQ
ncbi:MAG: LiaI-LiaF-like domain-containing protein [Terriglobales bacterium]